MVTAAVQNQNHLLAKLVRKQGRLLVVEAATSGVRFWQERYFQRTLTRKFIDWRTELSRVLVRTGFLELAARQADQIKRLPIPLKDKRRLAEESLDELFQPLSSDLLDSDERAAIEYHVRVHWMRMAEYGGVTALQAMGFPATSRRVQQIEKKIAVRKSAGDIVFEITDPEITDAIENRVKVVGATTTQAMVTDARNLIRDEVYLGTSSTQEVAKKLASAQGFPLWYAHRIARTEAQQAFQLTMYNTYQRSGVKRTEWITVGDNRVRDAHAANEAAKPRLMGQPFPSGEIYPGETSPNCRCTLQPDLSDPNLLLEPWDGSSGPYHIGPKPLPTVKPPNLASKVVLKKLITPKSETRAVPKSSEESE